MDYRVEIENQTEAMLADLAALVSFNSVLEEAKSGMPFGETNAKCLAKMLSICEGMGFRVKNLDNYCGYAEMGEGEEIIGIAGHLDIVPAGDGWNTDPFTMVREGDKIFGRGTTDDKGPVIQALYAMKLLKDSGVKLNKRVRLIFGCNEETGSNCMKHYSEVEEPITYGFTPDASYPLIYGEKGMIGMTAHSKKTKIISMNGGFVSNAVCHKCTTVIPAESVTVEALEAALKDTDLISFEVKAEGNQITIEARGLAAHASTPLLGVNAAGCTMKALAAAGFKDDFVDFYNEKIGIACDGAGIGLDLKDDYGDLTFNNGIVKMENGEIICTIDMRTPVTVSEEQLKECYAPYIEDERGYFEVHPFVKPLFFSRESDLVKALYKAYVDVTGDTINQPMVIGGGTYAKALSGIVAFGPEMPDKDYCIHNANEFAEVSEMQKTVQIYIQAIENLLAI